MKVLRVLSASPPPHRQTAHFINSLQQDSANPAALGVHFAVVILTPLKAFYYYGFGQ
jgi:hypothetical protein